MIIGAPLLLLSKRVGQLLDAMPTTWLVALQLYRVFGSWLASWLRGVLPGVLALPAGTGDVLTGLFAVPAAIAFATGTAQGRKAAILWNIFGLADFVVAITLGMIISPGPFQLIVQNGPSIAGGRLSQCADPCLRGAMLDPAARAVAAPVDAAIRRLICSSFAEYVRTAQMKFLDYSRHFCMVLAHDRVIDFVSKLNSSSQ